MKNEARKEVQISESPYFAPAAAIVVTLPVPITYPMRKTPGAIDDANLVSFERAEGFDMQA